MPKLTEDLKKPFVLEKQQRVEDTPMHKAIREAFVNMIIHADYRMDAGVLKIIKNDNAISFTNPGSLKLPKEQIYHGGESKARNPHMQTMLRMVGYGDNAGSGFPDILSIWKNYGLIEPELEEDTILNQITLVLSFDLIDGQNDAHVEILSEEQTNEKKTTHRLSEELKNERSSEKMSEVLSEVLDSKEYEKVEKIVMYLENNRSITPKIAEEITGKSRATVRRYLKMLVDTGYVRAEGKTSKIRYTV